MELFNGGNIALSGIPILSESEFRKEVIDRCRSDARLISFFGQDEGALGVRLFAFLAYDEDAELKVLSMRVPLNEPRYVSLANELLAANWFEREIAEQWAVTPEGHPWLKPLRYHSNYRGAVDIWPNMTADVIPGAYQFYAVAGEGVHEVGVGPVHAGIIEPGHFRFECHGEKILHLEIQLGYQHRGIERMIHGKDVKRFAMLSEAVAGDTSIGHSMAFCEVVESLSGASAPVRAQFIRAVALELERLANHVGDLGALGMDAGFLPSSSYFGRMRGDYLNLLLMITGNRFGKGLSRPGGVLFDIDEKMGQDLCKKLSIYKKEFEDVSDLLFSRPSVMARFEGVGELSKETATDLGLVGPAARACQIERDVRIDHSSGIWQFHHIPISLAATGDVYARALVRRQEVMRSLEFLLRIIPILPKGEIFTPLAPMRANMMAVSMVEGWRGEIVHVGITEGDGGFSRYKIVDPSFHNWFGLSVAIRGGEISDFPLCNKSFNLSYCGHDL